MNDKAEKNGIRTVRVQKLVVMGFFTEMEVGSNGMLKEVDDQVSHQHEKSGLFPAHFDTLRDHLHQRGRKHESCAESDEVAQVSAFPMSLDDNRAAEDVSSGCCEAEQDAG